MVVKEFVAVVLGGCCAGYVVVVYKQILVLDLAQILVWAGASLAKLNNILKENNWFWHHWN